MAAPMRSGVAASKDKTDEQYCEIAPANAPKGNSLGVAFMSGVAVFSMLCGFGLTVGLTKKKDPTMFIKGMVRTRDMPESASSFATRALGWGTFYSVTGFSVFCVGVWKLLGVNNMVEFKEKMSTLFPKVPKKEPVGRTEFESTRDLVNYLIELDEKNKNSDSASK